MKEFFSKVVKSKSFVAFMSVVVTLLTQAVTGLDVNTDAAAVSGCEKLGCTCSAVVTDQPESPVVGDAGAARD